MALESGQGAGSTTGSAAGSPEKSGEAAALAPELVRQVADRVYTMLLEELRIEYERRRLEPVGRVGIQGGSNNGLIR